MNPGDCASRTSPRSRHVMRIALGLYAVVLTVATHWPGLTQEDVPDWGAVPFDKAMHLMTFAGLAALLAWSRWWPRRSMRFNAIMAVLIGLTYGGIKETTQRFVDRVASWADLGADLAGLLLGAAVAVAVASVLKRRVHRSGVAGAESLPGATPRGGNPCVGLGEPAGDSPSLSPSHPDGAAAFKHIDRGGPGGAGGAADAAAEDADRFVGHAVLISALTLVSRFTGLLRDAVLVAVFGAQMALDAFLVGFTVPNLFRRLFGEGALTAAFIPHYSRMLKDDPALARRFASLCVCLVGLLLTVLTLIGEAALGLVLRQADTEKVALAVRLTMQMLPYMPLVCGVAFLGAVLQVHRRFGPAAAAPVLLNVVMIAAAAAVAWWGGATQSITSGGGASGGGVHILAWSVVLAGVMQIAWMGYRVWRIAPLTLDFAGTRTAFLAMLRTMLPMVVGLGVFQINVLLDSLIAYGLSAPPQRPDAQLHLLGRAFDYPVESGGVVTLTMAQRLYQFPLGVFAIAISTAIFPALAAAFRPHAPAALRDDRAHDPGETPFATIFHRGLRLTLFIGLPAGVGMMLTRVPLTRVFFEYGEFTTGDALRTAGMVAAYSSAVWAYSTTHVVTRAFYAADDAHTPLKVSLCMVGLNLLLNVILIWPLGVAGLAWSTAICATAQVVVLLVLVRRHVGRIVTPAVLQSWLRTAGMSAVMGAAIYAMAWPMDLVTSAPGERLIQLALLVGGGAVVYLGLAVLLGSPEVRWVRRRSVR